MANIVGESFDEFVIKQINDRQAVAAKLDRTAQDLNYLNNNNPWIKLASGVKVTDDYRLQDIGLSTLSGNALAKNYILFAGTSKTGAQGLEVRGGFDGDYNSFGLDFGFRPQPGIENISVTTKNRGSLREATIKVKAFNRQQFEIIEILYLRLGYYMLLEWGATTYVDGGAYQTVQNTLTGQFLDGKVSSTGKTDTNGFLQAIREYRAKYKGNYDGMLGKVANFDWSFNPDGSYDINIKLISIGDVIESLKVNALSEAKDIDGDVAEENEESGSEVTEAGGTNSEEAVIAAKNLHDLGRHFYKAKLKVDASGTALTDYLKTFTFADGDSNNPDVLRINFEKEWDNHYYYRFGPLLKWIQDNLVLKNGSTKTPVLNFDHEVKGNFMYVNDIAVSSDPRICMVKSSPKIKEADGSEKTYYILYHLPQNFIAEIANTNVGRIMNIYMNMGFVLQSIEESKNENNDVVLIDLLTKLCSGINQAFGNVNSLEPVIDETSNTIKIIDDKRLPNRDAILEALGLSKTKETAIFQVYGIGNNKGSFVQNFSVKTEITNELATTISIGAQANGAVVGEDATAFSAWNKGLENRIQPSTVDAYTAEINNEDALESLEDRYKDAIESFTEFLYEMKDNPNFDDDLIDGFTATYKNFISYLNAKQASENQGVANNTSVGFIPINLSLTMDGLSGMKIYQKFSILSSFLPKNYGDKLEFLIKGISHKVDGKDWTTTIESLSIPKDVTNKVPTITVTRTKPDQAPNPEEGGNSGGGGDGGGDGGSADNYDLETGNLPKNLQERWSKWDGESSYYVNPATGEVLSKLNTKISSGAIYSRSGGKPKRIKPVGVVIHYTAGGGNASSIIKNTWNGQSGIGAQYVIDRDGKVAEITPPDVKCGHAGGTVNASYGVAFNSNTIGFEVIAYGFAGGIKGISKTDPKYDSTSVDASGKTIKYRGHEKWQGLTPQQIESIKKLLLFLNKTYGIPLDFDYNRMFPTKAPNDKNPYNAVVLAAKKSYAGLWTHGSTPMGKVDIQPDPALVTMLKGLKAASGGSGSTGTQSTKSFNDLAGRLQKVYTLKDTFGPKGKPLFEKFKSTFGDDEAGAIQALRDWFNSDKTIAGLIKDLDAKDKAEFNKQYKDLLDQTDDLISNNVTFKAPSGGSKAKTIIVNPDF